MHVTKGDQLTMCNNNEVLTFGVSHVVTTGVMSPLTPKKVLDTPSSVEAWLGAMSTKEQIKPPLKARVFPTSTRISTQEQTQRFMDGSSITMQGIIAAMRKPEGKARTLIQDNNTLHILDLVKNNTCIYHLHAINNALDRVKTFE